MIFASFILFSCTKKEEYPIQPVIKFESFEKIANGTHIDQEGKLTISFTDGDGDIGLKDEDTIPPYHSGGNYYYNFIIDFYEKQNGEFVKIDLPSTFNSRIPYITADVPERGIKGTIDIDLYINDPTSPNDTIMFKAFIYDRALNKSNEIETYEIVVNK